MSYYGQKNYSQIQGVNGRYPISTIGCFLTAFSNICKDFGMEIDPFALNNQFVKRGIYIDVDDGVRDDLGWSSITQFEPSFVVSGTGKGWPQTNQAIVKFNYQSIQNPWRTVSAPDGTRRVPNMIDHFCKVADWRNHTIVDSWDGQIKGAVYGEPLAYAAYVHNKPAPSPTPPPPPPSGPNYDGDSITVQAGWGLSHAAKAAGYPDYDQPSRWDAIARLNGHASAATLKLFPGQRLRVGKYTPPPTSSPPAPSPQMPATYTVVRGDSLTSIAMRFGTSYQILAEMNDIQNPSLIYAGQVLRLPVNTSAPKPPAAPTIRYELLNTGKPMHIKKEGGADKWGFGNVKNWSDFISIGHFAQDTNVTIVAIAHVPVGKEIAAYYMDAVALGDYRSSGHVANTVGFNWADMADGFVEPPKPAPPPAEPKPPVPAKSANPEPTPLPEAATANLYKKTYKALALPTRYIARRTIMVHEFDTRRPDRQLIENMAVVILGTFVKDDTLYGRPKGSVDNGYWFGIPMDNLIPEDELYDTKIDLPAKAAMHRLSLGEHLIVLLSKMLSQYTRLIHLFTRRQEK